MTLFTRRNARFPMHAPAMALACILLPSAAIAQGANASLSGIVHDPTGAVIPNAHVTLTDANRGTVRTVESNSAGAYVLPQIAPGDYILQITSAGFAVMRQNLTLTVGQHAAADAELHVEATANVQVITAPETELEREDASLSTVTGPRAIRELPLNGRDVTQLAYLSPGVVMSRRINPDSQGLGKQISISGRRTNQVAFLLDGTDVNDAYNNTPGGASGTILGVDSVGQFRVLVSGYGAEFGRTGGGIIDEITRSGTSKLHGSAFEFARNSAMDAKNYFDSATAPIPAFSRNQFGGSLGGPISKRDFYFGNYEGLRQSLGVTTSALVPNATARGSAVASVQPFLSIIPTPNNTVFTDGTGYFRTTNTNKTTEDFFVTRYDHQQSDRTSYFARFQFDNANAYTPDSLQISQAHNRSRTQYLTSQMTHSFSDHLVNEARVAYNRSYYTLEYTLIKDIPDSLSFVPGRPFGSISVTGLAMIGPMRFGPNVNILNLFQGADDLTWTIGRHTIAMGVDEQQIIFPQEAAQSQNGFYQFTSVANFMAGNASSVEVALPGSNPQRKWRQHMDAAYITDTWRAADALTVTGGIRYEHTSVPNEVNGLQATVRDVLHDTADTLGPMYTDPSKLNFAPRLGFAYVPGQKNTSVRGAFGIYFDPLWTDFYLNAGSRQPPFFTVGTVTPATFPQANITPQNFKLGRIDVVQYNPASPYVMQWNLSLQQQLRRGLTFTLAYDANRGVHDQRIVDENQALPTYVNGRKFFPVGSTVRNPNFTAIRYKETNGLSNYNSLQAVLAWQWRNIFQLRSTYIWGKSIDTSSLVVAQGSENDVPQDPDSLAAEKGLSNYDLRNYSSTFFTTNLPRLRGPRLVAEGWQFNAIGIFASGAPFSALVSYDSARANFGTGPSPERPDLVPGRSSNPVKGGPVQYFDPTAFSLPVAGYYGNLGRNTLIGPGLISIDTALAKNFRFGDRARLQLRAEVFNLPNRPNFGIPSQRNVFTTTGRVASAGTITTTTSPSRQIQLGARFDF
jgi:hypothetical protein